jgi:septal ring factor EnvC (AmiA/AmiB activator)
MVKYGLIKKGVEILSEKYPLAVEKENNLMKELVEAQNEIISMHKFIVSIQPKLLLVEQQEKQLNELQANYDESISKLSHERAKNQGLEYDLKSSRSIVNSLREEVKELEKTLEKERSKSWLDKLLKR